MTEFLNRPHTDRETEELMRSATIKLNSGVQEIVLSRLMQHGRLAKINNSSTPFTVNEDPFMYAWQGVALKHTNEERISNRKWRERFAAIGIKELKSVDEVFNTVLSPQHLRRCSSAEDRVEVRDLSEVGVRLGFFAATQSLQADPAIFLRHAVKRVEDALPHLDPRAGMSTINLLSRNVTVMQMAMSGKEKKYSSSIKELENADRLSANVRGSLLSQRGVSNQTVLFVR